MQRTLLIIALVCLVAIAATFAYFRINGTRHISPNDSQSQTVRAHDARYWADVIKKEGPEKAHDLMLGEGNTISKLSAHMLAHSFGEALFDTGGLPSVVYCGAGEFLFGCYHQFMAMATAQYGVDAISKIKPICEIADNRASCIHGLGHGLIGAYGYDQSGLDKALAECKTLYSVDNDRQICADGVFMEYNLHMGISGSNASDHRTFSSSAAYEPCTTVASEFRDQCIFELPLWWYYSISASSTDAVFREMGDLCRSAPSTISQKACLTGSGFPVAVEAQDQADRLTALCALVGNTDSEQSICMAGAHSCFYSDPIHVVWKYGVLR